MAGTKTVTVKSVVDTYVDSAKPAKNFATGAQLRVKNGAQRSYVYFGFPAPAGANITSAKLRLWTKDSWGGASPTITVQRIAGPWAVSNVNWNNKPTSTGATATLSTSSTGDANLREFDITALLQTVADGAAWYGLEITSNSGTERKFRSAQAHDHKPEIVVTWSEAPDTPTTLNPGGGQAVSLAKPVLEMDYTDVSGSTTLAAVQVQLDSSPTGFATPDFDSGQVATTGSKARLDLSATAYGGLAESATIYWRGRVKDSAGLWSGWSAVTSFVRVSKFDLDLTSPSGVSPVVTDYTPVITWDFDNTQTKFDLSVEEADTGRDVYYSGQIPGPTTSHEVVHEDGSAALRDGVTYRVNLRVWDLYNRAQTLNDPPYVTASQEFTLDGGVVDPPENLSVVVQYPPNPGLKLRWTRDTAPDYFTVTMDGDPVGVNLDPADLLISGTTYGYTFTGLRPNLPHVFGVVAVEDGVKSTTVSVTDRMKTSGFWLIDTADRQHYLFLAQTGGSEFDMGEEGETLFPLGATTGVRITQSLRGYEGNISGTLVAEHGLTLQEWVDMALWMRSRAGRKFRLIAGTETFDVVTGNWKIRPTGDSSPGRRSVSFDFWQTSPQRIRPVV